MKTIIAIAHLALAAQVFGNDKIGFQTAKELNAGVSSAFELSKTNRAILKIKDHDYIILKLIDASRDGDWETFTEACSISWTLITSSSIQANTASGSIRYSSKQTNTGSFMTSWIGGSDTILLGGGISIRWSYDSRRAIFLYPSPGTNYAIIDVEPGGTDQSATSPESKFEDKAKPKPETEVRPK